MSYVTENLDPNESVLYLASTHWAAYISPTILLLIGVGFWTATQHISFFVFFGTISVLRVFSIRSRELAVTDKKVIGKIGIIRRNSLELRHNQLEGIKVDQGILGRMLGYGRVTVCGTGGSRLGLPGFADPLKVRTEVNKAGEAASGTALRS
jgi:uncharacterized membrane protein YdbT with pleckstrin-like domain